MFCGILLVFCGVLLLTLCGAGSLEAATLLLKAKADVNCENDLGQASSTVAPQRCINCILLALFASIQW